MQNYKMIIAYDGRKYTGYNKSKGKLEKSIQGKLELILSKLYEEEVEVISAVSTDAGVHAKGQIVNFTAPHSRLDEEDIFDYFEKYLTDDIIILSVEMVDERFHSRYLMRSATYEYRLWKKNAPNRPLFERQYVNLMNQTVDVDKMKKAAEQLVGEHDFLAFTTNKKTKKSIKKIDSIDVRETRNEIIITMTANGFLLNMERLIVGTLIQVGLGQLPMNTIEKAFKSKDMNDVGHKASAGALCLLSVEY
ncbi:tRNA pseudouridine38-40 synthase [Peptoclostridium litorale DSM 5388]|uniref:tRNA pseudouridine synthase A n=1 Tax=Peptoclostridium litorale DSM 5388 TaxID=1121324 RepID=A0A069RH48_PEPLI|nr:tRNA pseudouridine(38-40) synthase TruA [Peptoclostridium litorale]KDR96336.1 tRNA pseudouridine synthase A 2 [Peptoclostridium litorale DSM 5388]SIO26582.1 tRNA pseudouridine38-40 synthase [Peptoclostridium litorale DSM 5388]